MTIAVDRPFIRALLIDISGNLHIGSSPTSGAIEALQRLRASRIPFRFCSNTSKESTASLITRMAAMGFEMKSNEARQSPRGKREVWTSIGAVKQTVENMGLKRPYFLLSESARKEITTTAAENPDNAIFDSVVVGLAPASFHYEALNTAFRILIGEHQCESSSEPAPTSPSPPPVPQKKYLIATHKAKYFESDSPSGLSLGPGPFVTALEQASGIKALVVGKPSKTFFETVIGDFTQDEFCGHSEEDGIVAVIGDDVDADLGEGALELGLWRVLVQTGKYRPGDERRNGVVPPDEVFSSFAAFVDDLIQWQTRRGVKL